MTFMGHRPGLLAGLSRAWYAAVHSVDWWHWIQSMYDRVVVESDQTPRHPDAPLLFVMLDAWIRAHPGDTSRLKECVAQLLYRLYRDIASGGGVECTTTQMKLLVKGLTTTIHEPLSTRHCHRRDFAISFTDVDHAYTLLSKTGDDSLTMRRLQTEETINTGLLVSVTGLIDRLFPAFDADCAVDKMLKGRNWHPGNRWWGLDREGIKRAWDANKEQAAADGTKMHRNLELFYNDLTHEEDSREFALFKEYEREHVEGKLLPYRSEWVIYDRELFLTGSVDMLYEYEGERGTHPSPLAPKHLVLADWKRSKELKRGNPYERGCTTATAALPDCNLEHYRIQLSLYKYMLELNYNVVIDAMWIVVLHPDQVHYIREVVEWNDRLMQDILQYRRDTMYL